MNKFNVGDKVRIKQKEQFDFDLIDRTVYYVMQFEEYCGKVATIEEVGFYDHDEIPYHAYKLDVDNQDYYWHESQFELLERNEEQMINDLYFAKVRPTAIIPSKRDEDAGFDIYSNFEENYIIIETHETKLIPTGIASAFSPDYVAILKERGSTGTKGMGQRCGVIDSGFRGEWFVPLTNHNKKPIAIMKESYFANLDDKKRKLIEENYICYPYEKAICQAIMVEVPKLQVKEVDIETIKQFKSQRQDGALGSSKK